VDAHFYTTVPGRSFVMINLRKYKPGERLAEGPQVVEIVPEGAVLSYQGQEFLLTP
jgi:general secretion pathway protein B